MPPSGESECPWNNKRVMVNRRLIWMLFFVIGQAARARADAPATQPERIEWASLTSQQQAQVMTMLDAPDWPVRVFGMLRLERYAGNDVNSLISARLKDQSWQARCFAIRLATSRGLEPDAALLKSEKDGRVIRTALRHG